MGRTEHTYKSVPRETRFNRKTDLKCTCTLSIKRGLRTITVIWKGILFILTPIVLLPLVLVWDSSEAKCAYGLLIMAVYWITETIPLAVTAFMPCVIFPLLGVQGLRDIVGSYFMDTNMILIGGLMVALSVERSGLHKRIALRFLMIMGTNPQWLMLGFMLPTWFLSMWISNTATTAMMIPVAQAVLSQLENNERKQTYNDIKNYSLELIVAKDTTNTDIKSCPAKHASNDSTDLERPKEVDREDRANDEETQVVVSSSHASFCKGLCLSIAYAANVGGTATLTGTPPNLVLKNLVDELYEEHGMETPITFASWMIWGLPGAVICLILVWFCLQMIFVGWRKSFSCASNRSNKEDTDGVKDIIRDEYYKLGPIRFEEVVNLFFFVVVVLLWFTRNPGFMPGWGSFFRKGYTTDSVPVIFVAILLFIFPSKLPSMNFCKKHAVKPVWGPPLLDWDIVSSRLPWGTSLILGGGFALANVSKVSGLSDLIAQQLTVLENLPNWVIVMLVIALIASATEITSNSATTALFLPILQDLSFKLNLHPLYLMLPATVAASLAFMFPVATPPNAIVFSYGHLTVFDMVKSGIFLNLMCVLVVTAGTHTWGWAFFNLANSPWSVISNQTTITP